MRVAIFLLLVACGDESNVVECTADTTAATGKTRCERVCQFAVPSASDPVDCAARWADEQLYVCQHWVGRVTLDEEGNRGCCLPIDDTIVWRPCE